MHHVSYIHGHVWEGGIHIPQHGRVWEGGIHNPQQKIEQCDLHVPLKKHCIKYFEGRKFLSLIKI